MKKTIFVLTVVVSQNVFASGLADALSKAIQHSDGEKAITKEMLLVNEDYIEKATYKVRERKKQIIKDESTILADNTYSVPETKPETNNLEKSQLEAIEKELSVKGL